MEVEEARGTGTGVQATCPLTSLNISKWWEKELATSHCFDPQCANRGPLGHYWLEGRRRSHSSSRWNPRTPSLQQDIRTMQVLRPRRSQKASRPAQDQTARCS